MNNIYNIHRPWVVPTDNIRRPYGAETPDVTQSVGLHPRLLSVAPTGLSRQNHNNNCHTWTQETDIHRPYGAESTDVTQSVGLHPRLLSVAPTGLSIHNLKNHHTETLGTSIYRSCGALSAKP